MFAVWSSPNKKVPAYLEMGLEDRMSFVVSHLKWNFGGSGVLPEPKKKRNLFWVVVEYGSI